MLTLFLILVIKMAYGLFSDLELPADQFAMIMGLLFSMIAVSAYYDLEIGYVGRIMYCFGIILYFANINAWVLSAPTILGTEAELLAMCLFIIAPAGLLISPTMTFFENRRRNS